MSCKTRARAIGTADDQRIRSFVGNDARLERCRFRFFSAFPRQVGEYIGQIAGRGVFQWDDLLFLITHYIDAFYNLQKTIYG
jgi:hypothetical protein